MGDAATAAAATLGLTWPNAAVELPQISFAAKDSEFSDWDGDILAVAVTDKDVQVQPHVSGSEFENAVLRRLDVQLGGLLRAAAAEEEFAGRPGQSVVLRVRGQRFKRVALVGFAARDRDRDAGCLHGLGESVASVARAARATSAAILVADPAVVRPESRLNAAAAIASGALAEAAAKIASTYSDVFTATILDAAKCRELKMGSYLAVAAASETNPPYFIHLCYKPRGGDVRRKLALVGKGITFDSGGYNIKAVPVATIELMKKDMGGAAAVFGAAEVLGQIKPPGVEVHFISAASENMISGSGMRPGDIVTASNGKTIEVDNTDAEGRLTLADALVYACNQGVDKIIDLATLTGAIRVALGPSIAGILTPSDELAEEFAAAYEVSGEKFWRLPMEESYWESMESSIADMLCAGPLQPQAGAITAALFLKHFVDDKVQWMHIDIAGTVWSNKKRAGTGFGVTTLVEWVLSNSSS
ncbi:Leucine aminopeptidase 2 chloroplastic [Zea mays]|uniref:Leucine aminopeptidase 2 chloroplastic n=1 Tax=Zea mays TaxID=4577 RepID=A0A1D6H8U7_MAIZE|nr:Leucine aminopeptidase 2 chloroplastic [Zea mays]